jgi:hypothetical protein
MDAPRLAEPGEQFVTRFAQRIRDVFPGYPSRERTIAEFACRK